MAYQQLGVHRFDSRSHNLQPFRRWIDMKSQDVGGQEFKILSYNILAQDLLDIHRYLYDNHDPTGLNWVHRYELIVHEILDIKPDILCLQEGK